MDQKIIEGSMALQQNRITIIKANPQLSIEKLKVAAYTRVSSDSSDQLNSYAAQNTYFRKYITSKTDWEFVDVYADEGITGTSAEKRDDFQRMLSDCRKGKIDRIITKSVSRFARNIRECLKAIRELKSIGVSVYFEEQNIDTALANSELLLTIYASLAQAESESISANMRWSYEKRMQSGEFNTCKYPYGYRLIDKELIAYEPEAEIIRMIFNDYLSGMSCEIIAKKLTEMGLKTRDGSDKWNQEAVAYIITNERYKGDALLQKQYTTDTFPMVRKVNKGNVPQYYIENSNEPIVSAETFDVANKLFAGRSQKVVRQKADNVFANKIRCGICGTIARRKECRGITYWVCKNHFNNAANCPVTQIPEEEIKKAFLVLCFNLKADGRRLVRNMTKEFEQVRRERLMWGSDIAMANKQIAYIKDKSLQLEKLNDSGSLDKEYYLKERNNLAEQLRKAKLSKERATDSPDNNVYKTTNILLQDIEDIPDYIEEFDENIFTKLVDTVLINEENTVTFRLKNGLELTESIERRKR